jgi:hypothetical protein
MLGFSLVRHDIWQGMQTAISGNYVLYQTTNDLLLILTCLLPESNFELFNLLSPKFLSAIAKCSLCILSQSGAILQIFSNSKE